MGVRIMRRGGGCRIDLTHGIGDQLYPTTNWEAVHGLGRAYARPYGAGWFWQVRDLLIEQMKYRKLIEQAVQSNLLPFYINSTPLGIYSFDLNDIPEPEWVTHLMPATTDFENKAKIPKVVGYLLLEDAIRL